MTLTERESDYYDSAYLADYYESLWTDHQALEDIKIYWDFFKAGLTTRQHQIDQNFVLLDVGAGTGRVIYSLIEKAASDDGVDLDRVHFIGIDKSRYMLDQARKSKRLPSHIDASWFMGSATAIQDIKPFRAGYGGQADLLIFAFSGINHLYQPGEVDQFFSSAREALRPGGLALFSVCTPLLDAKGRYLENPYGKVKVVNSKELEGILYREREIGQRIRGDLFINSLETEVVRVSQDQGEQVIERNCHNIPLKLLTRGGLYKSIAMARLEVLEEKDIRDEVIFVLKAVT